ncbi:hypothetical protein [Fluviicola sp.]|uniref:hypothetical protein n=1 Tax=Fluviicola sp. TaxID=1917219 RepID=UPI0031E19C5A
MKKNKLLIILSGCLLLAQNGLSQNDSVHKYKNEFGIDVTGTIRFFTKFQNTSDYSYSPTYYLTYRRYFEPGNIRFGIGGQVSDEEIPGMVGDSSIYKRKSNSVDSRLGWEFKSELSKRWQVFYGLDFRLSIGSERNEAAFFNGGYAVGFENHSVTYGFAPVLGFRFRINNRISLLTEANFSVNFSKYKTRNIYTPLSGFPDLPDEIAPNTKSVYTSFSQPIALYFVFNI